MIINTLILYCTCSIVGIHFMTLNNNNFICICSGRFKKTETVFSDPDRIWKNKKSYCNIRDFTGGQFQCGGRNWSRKWNADIHVLLLRRWWCWIFVPLSHPMAFCINESKTYPTLPVPVQRLYLLYIHLNRLSICDVLL